MSYEVSRSVGQQRRRDDKNNYEQRRGPECRALDPREPLAPPTPVLSPNSSQPMPGRPLNLRRRNECHHGVG